MSRSGRGGVGPSRRSNALPNLAVAGKREQSAGISSRGTEKLGRGRGKRGNRGPRGGSRGNRRTQNQQQYIEQQGIFSSGLNDGGKYGRSKELGSSYASIVVKSENRKDGDGHVIQSTTESGRSITYESEWLSDDEADNEELRELFDDQFISDLKFGDVVPLVLPPAEETQFAQLALPRVKVEATFDDPTESGSGSLKMEIDDEQKNIDSREQKVQVSRRGEIVKINNGMINSIQQQQDYNGSIVLFQLPSTVGSLSKSDETSAEEQSSNDNDAKPKVRHCLEGFTSGSTIGKFRLYKSGKVELSIHGMDMDVTSGITRQNESLMLIESNERDRQLKNDPSCTTPLKGFVLGEVTDSFICSQNLPKALDERKKNVHEGNGQSLDNNAMDCDDNDDEMKKLLAELVSIEKKELSWKKWASDYIDSDGPDEST